MFDVLEEEEEEQPHIRQRVVLLVVKNLRVVRFQLWFAFDTKSPLELLACSYDTAQVPTIVLLFKIIGQLLSI